MPLPLTWLDHWAPMSADIWARALRPFAAATPEWASISLAPGRTLIEGLKASSYGLLFAVSARIAGRNGIATIAWILFGCALAVALVTAGHQVLGAERLYGFYRPLDALTVAPILNNNSLGGYLNLGLCAGLGLLFRRRSGVPSALLGVGLLLIAAEVILCQSRGAVGCFLLALLLILLLELALWRRGARAGQWTLGRQLLALILLFAGAVALALLGMRVQDWNRLADESLQKLDIFGWAAQLTLDQPALGVGRGAFGSVFLSYAKTGHNASFDHAENVLLQWATEWGLGVTLLALSVLGWALWPLRSRAALRSSLRRCLLVGSLTLVLQNLVDLGLEIPAVAALLATALGGLLGSLQHGATAPEHAAIRPVAPGRWLVRAGVGLAAVALALALVRGSEPLPQLRRQLYGQLANAPGGRPTAEFWSELRGSMLAFPADPYFPLLGSSAALAAGQNALPWITRALERAPHQAQAQLQLARILKARGATDQALGALRRAVELDGRQSKLVKSLGLSWGLAPTTLRQAVPDGAAGAQLLRELALREQEPAARLAWLQDAVQRNPEDAESHYWLATELLADLKRGPDAVACRERGICIASARAHALRGERTGSPRVVILEAELQVLEGNARDAEARLRLACERLAGNPGCEEALVTLALANQSDQLPDAVKRYVASGCATREGCGRTYLALGHLFARAGRWNTALSHYEHAAQEAPSPDTWRALAEVSGRLGYTAIQADAQRRLRLLEAGDALGVEARAAEQRGVLQKQMGAEPPVPGQHVEASPP